MRRIRQLVKKLNAREKIAVPYPVNGGEILKGKVAFITGGSSGIGYAIAQRFLEESCKVIISGSNTEKTKRKCHELNSENAKWIVCDVSNLKSIQSALAQAIEQFNGCNIDILVNCAGINLKSSFFEVTELEFDKTISVNIRGAYFVSQVFSKHMIERQVKGHILNICSASSLRPAWSPYEISKWALRGFTAGLADTLLPHQIVVNALAPGPTATEMFGVDDSSDIDLPQNPIGRYATTKEIANLAVILVSDFGNLIVGDVVYATGGAGTISMHR